MPKISHSSIRKVAVQ